MIRTGKLANGFTYFIRHNEEPKHRAFMYLVNNVGALLEDDDQRGLAHFMEHMNFNGTRNFPGGELVDFLQRSGLQFGADINAYTGFDETVYQLPIPVDKPGMLAKGLLVMHDWCQYATLDPVKMDKERGVVLEEERLRKGAGDRMEKQYWPMLMNHSRYAARVPIGLDTVIKHFQPVTLRRFYQDWYRPDLQALIIVGDVNADSLEKVVRNQFSDLKNPVHERPRPDYKIALSGRNQFMTVTDPEETVTKAQVIIKHPKLIVRTTGDYRKSIIRILFNQMLRDRYAEAARQVDPPFVQASASIDDFMGNLDSYTVKMVARPGELERGFKASWQLTESVKRYGFTPGELIRAKSVYMSRMEDALNEKDKTPSADYARAYQLYFLKHSVAPGIETEYRLSRELLPGITLADVNGVAGRYIKDSDRDILIQAPARDLPSMPTRTQVENWMADVRREKLAPYRDELADKPLLAALPLPGHVKSETRLDSIGVTGFTLSNGLKVFLKPTAFRADEISFIGFAPGGTSLASDSDYQSVVNAATVIPAGGAGNYNFTQLGKYFAGKKVGVKPFINERYQGISGSASTKDLEAALQLVYAYFTEPKEDTAVFRSIIARSEASIINRANDPDAVFNDTVATVLGDNNFRRTGPSLAKLRRINLDKAYTFFKERFADAGNFTFTFVGNIDTVTVKPLLEKYLGSLPAAKIHEQARDLGIHIPAGRINKVINKGTAARANVLLVYSGKYDFDAHYEVAFQALKETLQIRLIQRLREQESGVYSPGVFISTSKYPQPRFSLYIQFGCAPGNVDKLIAAATDELTKIRLTGPLQSDLDKWRIEDKTAMETDLQTNGFWLSYLTGQLQNCENLGQIKNYVSIRDSVTSLAVKELASMYLNDNNFIRFVLLPEKSLQ
ncbi:MAG TPA: insulinase family protein [Mucilaginibacter sp.]